MIGEMITRRGALRQLAVAGSSIGAARTAWADDGSKLLPVRIINTQGITVTTMKNLMQTQGYLQQFGVDPQFIDVVDGNKIIGALVGGDADICIFSGFGQVLPAIEKGGRLKILAGSLVTPPHLVYAQKPEIKSVKDLEGRIVGVGPLGALLHQVMVALLTAKGVDVGKVQFVNAGSAADVFRAVLAGKIDAGPSDFTYFDPKLNVHVLEGGDVAKELPDFTVQASYSSDRVISERRETLVRTLAAYAKLFRFLKTSPAKEPFFAAFLSAVNKTDRDLAEKQWDFIQTNNAYSTDLVISEERVNYAQKLNLATGVQKRALSYQEATDMSIAKDAIALLNS